MTGTRPRFLDFLAALLFISLPADLTAQPIDGYLPTVQTLERRVLEAEREVERLRQTLDTLLSELSSMKREAALASNVVAEGSEAEDTSVTALSMQPDTVDTPEADYTDSILVPDLADDERGESLEARPELFVQARYQAAPIEEATREDVTRHFTLSRMELDWAGRISDAVGLGFEIQYHPALEGAAEELVNDAFAEYYVNEVVTIRAGQFVKPFGFDIQHSSSARESPERGIFAGYFFPGQRDRGLMVRADLAGLAPLLTGTTLHAGVFNGNRFFDDTNDKLNYNLRLRKVFDRLPLAVGASLQIGNQALPPGVLGTDRENLYGVDVQYVAGRLGMRAEYVRGNMPSTLLALEPEFTPGFTPGAKSSGGALFFNYRLTSSDDVYWRYDQFDNDPVTGEDVRAFNVGYLRALGPNSRLGVDYQSKSDVTFNDDELNTKLTINWNLTY